MCLPKLKELDIDLEKIDSMPKFVNEKARIIISTPAGNDIS